MKKKKLSYILLTILLMFSFTDGVLADTYGNKTKIGFYQKNMDPTAATAPIDDKWLKEPKYDVACKYVFAPKNGAWAYHNGKSKDFIIVQFSYNSKDKTKYEINYSTDTWSSTWKNQFKSEFKDYDPTNQLTEKCPKMYFGYKNSSVYKGEKYNHLGDYIVTFKKHTIGASYTWSSNVSSSTQYGSSSQCNTSVSWLQEPSSTGKRFSCIYTSQQLIPCIIVQMNFSVPATFGGDTASIAEGTDKEVTFKSNFSSIKSYKNKNEVKTGELGFYTNLLNKIQSENSDSAWSCPSSIRLKGIETNDPKIAINATDGYKLELINKTEGATNQEIKEEVEESAKNRKSHEKKSWWGVEYEALSCEDLLGEELVGYIQQIVNIIKIVVPILLIVLGTIDFGKAIFVNDEGEMKKAQTKFIKRLIIAVAFFLVPTLITLLLNIAHSIWPSIEASVCGITF